MRSDAEGLAAPRRALFESLEDRLVLSAHALANFFAVRPAEAPPPLETPFFSEAAPLADTLSQGGVSGVRSAYGFTGAGQTVAIIDTGIAYDHYALGRGFGPGSRVVGGWDFAENDANPYDDGPAGFHGTHVAGIVGSSDARYSGVAPDVDFVALRVFDDQGNGNFAWVESALRWVYEHRNAFANPITTVNLSLGTNWNSHNVPNWAMLEEEFALLRSEGIFISVAAGNSFASYRTPGLSYPAASPHVTPVASVGESGQLSAFSQRSARVIAAPGERIMSTVPDFLFGGDGVPNDFMAASGTSMAAPYVAGASALLRQAMQFAGHSNITQDTLYATMYNTADLVYDAATNATYRRLNLERAIDSVMPADDYGSTVNTAFSLGTLTASRTISGMIGRLDDRDFFSFTAAQSGTVRFSAATSGELAASWFTPTGGTSSGNTLTLDVVAGQTYTVGLGTSAGIGRFTLTASLESSAPQINLGTIDFRQVVGQNIAGETWYQVTASRAGTFTAEALFNHAAGNIDIEMYNASRQLIGSSASATSGERIDVSTAAGQVLFVRVTGANSNVDLRFTNLVSRNGNQVEAFGTAGNDTFSFVAGSNSRLTINGVLYNFGSTARVFNFHGGAGNDSISIIGTAAKETATLRVGEAQIAAASYRVAARSFETVTVVGNGGRDVARMYDSAGNDVFTASPVSATLRGAGFSHTAIGFANVAAYASTGHDTAELRDSAGNDRFVGYARYSYMSGTGFYNYAAGFDSVLAISTGGNDRADLYGTSGSETLTRTAQQVELKGNGFSNAAAGFATLRAYGGGGIDEAVFREIGAGDYFYGRTNAARLTRSDLNQQIFNFAQVSAHAAANQSPRADVRAVNYVFQQFGQWQ